MKRAKRITNNWKLAFGIHEIENMVDLEETGIDDHPLSLDKNSKWAYKFAKSAATELIKPDVNRTFSQDDLNLKLSLERILCAYSLRKNYRQGMNEICGIVLQACKLAEYEDYEAQSLQISCCILDRQQVYFEGSFLTDQSKLMLNVYLRAINVELFEILKNIDIEPHIYAMKWYRLLFLRQVQDSNQIFVLWDMLFGIKSMEWSEVLNYACATLISMNSIIIKQNPMAIMSLTIPNVILFLTQVKTLSHDYNATIFDLKQKIKN